MLNKNEKYAFLFTLGVFAAQFFDIFIIHSDNSIFGDNIVARLIGIALGLIASKLLDFNLKEFCFKVQGWFSESLIGIALAVVPIVICFSLEFLYFKSQGYNNLPINFVTPNYYFFGDSKYRLVALGVYALVLLIGVVFKEMYFRGFLITQFSPKYGLLKANVIQSLLYCGLSIPYIIYSIVSGKFSGLNMLLIVYIILAYPINNFISGMKWGFFYKINGSIWMSVADHFVNNLIMSCIFISSERLPEKWFIFEVFAVQIISCLMFIPLYILRDKANIMIAEEVDLGLEVLRAGGDLYSPEEEKNLLQSDDLTENSKPSDNSNQYFGGIIKDYLHTDVIDLRDVLTLEEPVPVSQIKNKPSEETLVSSIESINVPESSDTNYTHVEDYSVSPSELSKQYFNTVLTSSVLDDKTYKKSHNEVEDLNSNSECISNLVKDFFDSQLDKHTF